LSASQQKSSTLHAAQPGASQTENDGDVLSAEDCGDLEVEDLGAPGADSSAAYSKQRRS